MAKVFNRAAHKTATAGTGDLTLGAALLNTDNINVCGWDSFSGSGVANNDVVAYLILDSNGNFEYGTATYLSAGPTLSGRTVERSSIAGVLGTTAITTTGSSTQVFITARRKDLHDVFVTLVDGATINWDMRDGSVATVTLGGNRTLAAPTNRRVGRGLIQIVQDGTGSRTLTWNAVFKWPSDTPPVLSTGAAAFDLFEFIDDGSNLYMRQVHFAGVYDNHRVTRQLGSIDLNNLEQAGIYDLTGGSNLPTTATWHYVHVIEHSNDNTQYITQLGWPLTNDGNGILHRMYHRRQVAGTWSSWLEVGAPAYQTLTDAATIAWDTEQGKTAQVTIAATGRTMGAPTNLKAGDSYTLIVIQDGTGSRTITTWNTVFKWAAGVAPVLTTTAGAKDIISGVSDGTNIYCTWMNDFK